MPVRCSHWPQTPATQAAAPRAREPAEDPAPPRFRDAHRLGTQAQQRDDRGGGAERVGDRLAALDRDGRDHRAVLDGDDQATRGRVGLGVQAGEAVEVRGVGEGRVAELQTAALLAAPGVAGLLADRALALVRERGGEGGVAEHVHIDGCSSLVIPRGG